MPTSDSCPAPADGDAEIARLLREQDGYGLQLLLTRHGARVRAGLRKSFGAALNDTEIDDAMSRASYQVWRSASAFDAERGSLGAWFFVIARNSGLELIRGRQRHREQLRPDLENVAGAANGAASPEPRSAAANDYLCAVHECIAQLPRLQRAILEADLRAGDTADAGDLAATLQTTRNTVYVSRSTARKALRKMLMARGHAPRTSSS